MIINSIIILIISIVAFFLFSKKIRNSSQWQAIVTPLASIIGSGFLVIAPLLAQTAGRYSLIAIILLILIGYACGMVMRFNISKIEPLLENKSYVFLNSIERFSKMILGIAYIISVSFYLQLLSAFLLKGFYKENIFYQHIITSLFLIFIAIIGKFRGFNMLEKVEEYAVNIKLSIIAGLIVALAYFNIHLFLNGQWHLQIPDKVIDLNSFRVLFGSLIVVQGFETSRFLGHKYSAEERIVGMRHSQILSGIIYFVFILLVGAVFTQKIQVTDTEIIDLVKRVASILPLTLVFAAVMSQLSAAVADTVGTGGLIVETLKNKISQNNSYLLISFFAIVLTWLTDVFVIISLASRAFAFYYALQSFEATIIAFKEKEKLKIACFGLLSFFLFLVTLFGTPASV
jgi:hypothetical protein